MAAGRKCHQDDESPNYIRYYRERQEHMQHNQAPFGTAGPGNLYRLPPPPLRHWQCTLSSGFVPAWYSCSHYSVVHQYTVLTVAFLRVGAERLPRAAESKGRQNEYFKLRNWISELKKFKLLGKMKGNAINCDFFFWIYVILVAEVIVITRPRPP
jgi:hypothetical protein